MEEYDLDEGGESFPIYFDPITIEHNKINHILNLQATDKNNMTLSLNDTTQFPSINYTRSMAFKEIKDLNKEFSELKSQYDFYNYIKSLSVNNKLTIKKQDDKISLIFIISKKQEIIINLYSGKKDIDLNIKEIYQELSNIKKEISAIKKENEEIKKDNNTLKINNEELKNKINLLGKDNRKLLIEINKMKKGNKEVKKDIIEFKENKRNKKYKNSKDINSVNEELVDQLYQELEDEYGISGFISEKDAKDKIRELKYDREKINEWIENTLING